VSGHVRCSKRRVRSRHRDREQRQREALADAILRRRDDIDRQWLDRVLQAVQRDDVTPTELRDSMPAYLVRLAEGLRRADTAEDAGSSAWKNVAREHADTRVRLGFDIDQLVHEFIVLRQVIFSVLQQEGVLVDVEQAQSIAELIEGAISAAVKSYVESRDFELRRQSAEHIGFVTHELRNPLTTAMLGATQLRQTLEVTGEQQRILDILERNHRRLADLIDGVLIVERDAHALRPRTERIALSDVIKEPVAAARVTAEAKGLHLEAHFDPDLVVEVDPKLTTSAIENVVLNAVKYTDEGDVHVDVEDHPREVVVHVRDSCSGLSREELRTIFEPFQRGHHGKTGSGLGLAIARRAVESQGGSIHAESGHGRGCHFWLTLPKPRP
jgi:signal transduction histidine kinase